ncbi:hypothetical protein AeRB84_010926 [Aphanomyces euteiches]|nr:hypothetical protein AeRB84_010926 [Aphanomyces euteiches]
MNAVRGEVDEAWAAVKKARTRLDDWIEANPGKFGHEYESLKGLLDEARQDFDKVTRIYTSPQVASNAPVQAAVLKRKKIELTPAGLLEFLRLQMKNPKDFKHFRPLLPESNRAFKLSGREKALNQAAHCMKRISLPISETTKADRKIPVCAGLSGLGKSRMLEEWEQIFDLAGVSGPRLGAIARYYYHDHMHQAIERSMPIEASFSWRLLHQLFLQDNGLHLSKWFCESLPQNAADLRLKTALEAIREKCIEMEISSPQETAIFHWPKKDLLRDLVDILGAAMEGPVDGIRIYPMLAGTDLSAISIVNSSKTEILRLSMPLLAPSEIETAVSSVVNGPLLLTESRVRRHLFYIGGVPRWCFEYISLLLQKIDATGNEKLSMGDIDSAFGIINQSYLEKWGKGLEDIDFIKLAAFYVSGVQVNNASRVVGGMKWSRMQDCGLCLLTDDSKVTIPYAIFHRIGRLVPSQYSEAEGCFITCVRGLIRKVDCLIYDKQIGALWKVFGAHFHALRINAFIIIGQPVINLSDLFHGALMVGCDDDVQLIPTKVMQYDDKYGKNIQPEIGCHTCLHSSEGHNHNWLTEGFVVINGDNGNGVDIFFALKKNKCDGYVVCLNGWLAQILVRWEYQNYCEPQQ